VTWPRIARIVVAVVGLGCAAAIFVYTRKRPAPAPPPQVLSDPTATVVDAGALQQFLRSSGAPIKVACGKFLAYPDGRGRCEKAKVEGLEDTRFTIAAYLLETRRKPGATETPPDSYEASGNPVVVTTDDGLRLESATASYDAATRQLTIPGAVTFVKGRLSGRGVGATYDRELDAITLLDQATARVQPDAAGKGAADATAKQMSLVRGQHTLLMTGNARIAGELQTLTANQSTVQFTADESAIKFVELRGAGRVTPGAGSAADMPAMSADNITMALYEDGLTLQHATLTGRAVLTIGGKASKSIRASYIDFFTGADGRTLTRLQARDGVIVDLVATADAAGRRITAAAMSATGEEKKGLTSARFDGNPVFEEMTPAGPVRGGAAADGKPARTGKATALELTLGGQLDAIESADFLQNAEFKDGTMTGRADIAQYFEAKKRLLLLPNPRDPRRRSSVTTPDLRVDATTRIDVQTGTQDLHAQGNVTTQMKRTAADAASQPGALFDGDGEVIGEADTLDYVKATGQATYTGTKGARARLRQGETSIQADLLVFTEKSRNLVARGAVDSSWMLAVTPKDAKPAAPGAAAASASLKKHRVEADTLHYTEAARTSVYVGTPVTLKTEDGTVEAGKITFTQAAASKSLESMRAEGDVMATWPGGSEAVAHVLVYDAASEDYTLLGKDGSEVAQVKSRKKTADGAVATGSDCSVSEGLQMVMNRRTGEARTPGRGEAPRNTFTQPCSQPLRRVK